MSPATSDDGTTAPAGPLAGLRVVELAGLGPVPFACMMLSDLGADVVKIDRPSGAPLGIDPQREILFRGRPSVAVDLQGEEGAALVRKLASRADVLVEGFRPGVAERLGIGPERCRDLNPQLIYVRCTGWGQDGPLARVAGHDINYSALAGALGSTGERHRKPVPALNLVADFGGGGTFAVIGVLAALAGRERTGEGQVVDAAMVDGVSYLLASIYSMRNRGEWHDERESNIIDGGYPFYDTYRCADGRYVAVGPLEPAFWSNLVARLGRPELEPMHSDPATWPRLREVLTEIFEARTRDEWAATFEGIDACVFPVLGLDEAPGHPHLAARETFLTDTEGTVQPAPAPRFSAMPGAIQGPPTSVGAGTEETLGAWGFERDEIATLSEHGAIHLPEPDAR